MSQPKFFRADDEEELGERPKPAPGDWFGAKDSKYRQSTPTFSEDRDLTDPGDHEPRDGYEGWRQFFNGGPREPLWNPLLTPEKRAETIKFRDRNADRDKMVWVLEHAAEIFEAQGHDDLAAECETLCELAYSED